MSKKYKKFQKAIFAGASSGIVAGMLLVGSSTVFAEANDHLIPAYTQNAGSGGMHMMHRWNSTTKINALTNHLGLDRNEINQELKSGKALKQILQENGIVPGQLQKALISDRKNKDWKYKKS